MIDWSKLGPANSPTPATPDTTAPVAPSAPGSLATPGAVPTVDMHPTGGQTGYQTGNSGTAWSATQEDVNHLDPGQKMARGIDILGNALFGQGNGSLLGGVPLLGDIVGAGGNAIHAVATVPEKIGIELPATALSHIPLGWVPGGADDTFRQIGDSIKDNPQYAQVYAEWQKVNAAAGGDVLGGGNLRGDFNAEFMKMQDDMQHDSVLGSTPVLSIGSAGVGSVGGGLSAVINSFLGIGSNTVQGALGHTPAFDPYYNPGTQISHLLDAAQNPNKFVTSPGSSTSLNLETMNDFERFAVQNVQSGKWTESQAQDWIDRNINTKLDRVDEIAARYDNGMEVSDVEKQAIEAYKSGAWSKQHAGDYIVSHGQGITRNPLGQALGSVILDPLTYATLGAGSISKLGAEGVRIAEAGGATLEQAAKGASFAERLAARANNASELAKMASEAKTPYEKLALTVATVQNSQMGPAFRIARGLIDPLGVYKPSSVARATTDLVNGAALAGVERAFGPNTIKDGRAIMREVGQSVEGDTHMASFAMDKAHELAAAEKQASLLQEGFGEAMLAGQIPLDETIHLAAQNAGRDATTKVTDYVQRIMKTTFTPEEMRTMPARLASVYGRDISYWSGKLKGASNDLKAWLHAMSYKGGEKDFVESVAKVDREAFKSAGGELPLDKMVLMNSETLDDVLAQRASASLKATLASGPNSIDNTVALWNDLSRRYPTLASFGYAKASNIDDLIKELDKAIERGAITRRALTEELSHPALQPVRDFLDRHTMTMSPEELAAARQEFEQEAAKVAEQRSTLEQALAATQTASGRAKAGMKAERDAAQAALEHFNSVHPADEFAKLSDQLPLWRVGFRPDEEVAWGLTRDPVTGLPKYDRVPTISHVVDAVPGRQRFSDTTRNVLGQIIGPSGAERINKPIDSIEAFVNTVRDGVTGQRLVTNIEQRFERSMFDAGVPKPLSAEIMRISKEVAGLNSTTLRGVNPGNIWEAVHEAIPRGLVLKDGSTLNQHIVMDHLLKASEGDLRIMGLTSKLTQRMRNGMRAAGLDPVNWTGQMTVTMYNKLRYSQPMFLIQRITDAPYYSILYGVTPVGKGLLTGAKAETQQLLDAIGRTGLARHFSMDMPEFATRTNFTEGIKSAMQQAGLKAHILDKVHSAPDAIIANNMTNMMHARLGDIVKGALDNLMTAAEKADPSIRAEMMAQADEMVKTFGEWRRIYSESAGRVLDDNEVGLRYMQDHLNAVRRAVVNADGTLDYTGLLREADLFGPDAVGKIESFRPDWLAHELDMGYADSAALRADVTGTVKKINGEFQLVKGEKSLPWLEQHLRDTLHVHPDKLRRIMAYYSSDWDTFWYDLSRPVEKGGLDISSHYAKEAQAVIAAAAKERGMDPWEYLSGTMGANIGIESLNDNMAKLIRFLQAGKADQPLEAWSDLFRGHLDVSAQQTLIAHFENSAEGAALNEQLLSKSLQPAEWGQKAVKSRPGQAPRMTGDLPANFTTEPGYAYRIDTIDRMRGGLHADSEGVSIGAPDTVYIDGRPGLGVFRVKADPADLNPYVAVQGAAPVPGYGQMKAAVPPENIEMLTADGWKSLGEDPMNKIMSQDFPNLLRQRAASGVPHPDPEVEGYMQAFTKWLKSNVSDAELAQRTRGDLRSIVESIPTKDAVNFNRTHDLVVTLLKDKIADAQQDVFRLAEMQTKRTVIERSLNHPLFGLYPSSYMWGKVLPETVKFLAKNPYAATYVIADVQRAIATQREYDPQVEATMKSMDRSAGMFLLDYLTPGLPWSDHEARLSPMVRDILGGKWGNIWPDELNTVSPDRWIKQVRETMKEIPGALDVITGNDQGQTNPAVQSLSGLAGGPAPTGPATTTGTPGHPSQITGTVPAAGLQSVLADDLSRLQSILIDGKDAAAQ